MANFFEQGIAQGRNLIGKMGEAWINLRKLNRADQLGENYYRRWAAEKISYEKMKEEIVKIAQDEGLNQERIWKVFDQLHNPKAAFNTKELL